MKLLTRRSFVLVIFILIFTLSLIGFTANFSKHASAWATQPYNKHIYENGILTGNMQIVDRNDLVLFSRSDDKSRYNKNEKIRKATMHAVGDLKGNIATSAQVAFKDKLVGFNLLNGVYRFNYTTPNSLKLTLDSELCLLAHEALNGRKGTVGVYNYETGEILCMVSSPTFDPENPPDIGVYNEKYEGVYMNRFLSASYTPGSIFKLVTAAAAIDNIEEIDSRTFNCSGEMQLDQGSVTCPSPHGQLSFKDALAKSCNISFAEISLKLGKDTLEQYAEKIGFNSAIKVNKIKTTPGEVDLSRANDWNLAWAGIGQYKDTANPINFLAFMGSVANEGKRIDPVILKKNAVATALTNSIGRGKSIMSKDTANRLKEMMRYNVTDGYGDNLFMDLSLCAKTGTAEVGGDQLPHAWFAGFMDREDCPLAFIVIVENGGSGIGIAAPIANKVLQAALLKMQ